MSDYQFANIGGLIQLYFKTPELLEPFFDLEGIRYHKQLIYVGTINKASIKNIFVHTFAMDDTITFTSTQYGFLNRHLAFCFMATKAATIFNAK